jgi:hypothetical protein
VKWLVLLFLVGTAHADELSIPSVMDKRWSASTGYGPGIVSDDDGETLAGTFELTLRFRIVPQLQINAGLSGVFVKDHAFGGLYADVHYRMLAERPWNPYVYGGLGYGGAFDDDSSGLLMRVGAGLERRLHSWAFAGDLNVASLADRSVKGGGLTISAIYYWGRAKRSRRAP